MFAEVEDQVEGRLVLVELGGLRSTDLDLEKELDRNIVYFGKLQVYFYKVLCSNLTQPNRS